MISVRHVGPTINQPLKPEPDEDACEKDPVFSDLPHDRASVLALAITVKADLKRRRRFITDAQFQGHISPTSSQL